MQLLHGTFFSILVITITLNQIPTSCAGDVHYSKCSSPFHCANLKNLSYPFWGFTRPPYCGHPAFNLQCTGEVATLTFMSESYRVLEVNNSDHRLKLVRTEYWNNICPTSLRNIDIGCTFFDYGSDSQNLTLYYDCPSFPQSDSFSPRFNCSINGTQMINYFVIESMLEYAESSEILGTCKSRVVVPIFESEAEVLRTNSTVENLKAVLDNGFGVEWNANNSLCDECQNSGGHCGYNPSSSEFACYCRDGSFPSTCKNSDRMVDIRKLARSNGKYLQIPFSEFKPQIIKCDNMSPLSVVEGEKPESMKILTNPEEITAEMVMQLLFPFFISPCSKHRTIVHRTATTNEHQTMLSLSSATTTIVAITFILSLHHTTSLPPHAPLSTCRVTSFNCGTITNLSYPFTGGDHPSFCGPPQFHLNCQNGVVPVLNISSLSYRVISINSVAHTLTLARLDLWNETCTNVYVNSTFDGPIFSYGSGNQNLTLFYECKPTSVFTETPENLFHCESKGDMNESYSLVGPLPSDPILGVVECVEHIAVPILKEQADRLVENRSLLGEILMKGFNVNYKNPYDNVCVECVGSGGQCGFDSDENEPICICGDQLCPTPGIPAFLFVNSLFNPYFFAPFSSLFSASLLIPFHHLYPALAAILFGNSPNFARQANQGLIKLVDVPVLQTCSVELLHGKSNKVGLIIGICVGGVAVLVVILGCVYFMIQRRRKIAYESRSMELFIAPTSSADTFASTTNTSQSLSSYQSSKSDPVPRSYYFGVQVFTYEELEEATKNFDTSRELGEGGFGTVYKGELKDGRIVAVKRHYESNSRRIMQFMNEVQILAGLRHKNLVTLFGCTSKHSRELLLVYEFIPNGTVAYHLQGRSSESTLLPWSIRLNIAVETAEALAYLHAKGVIHRDVKTNNLLLDDQFRVKVADFGLSRDFPNHVTHVSTAPQGTPGYVDPEYYQCYQLTDKSDVYSFGVVLVELISSLQAVDINRNRSDVNLSNMAVNKIQNQELHELVDPYLGFEWDHAVRRMTTAVAELAFRCLQQEREMRPSMNEVVEILRGIKSDGHGTREETDVLDIRTDEIILLKKAHSPVSPDSVVNKWVSGSSVSNSS
ncbi:unnamed protein product [Sphenostylis stenocarpa]|uniref:non-specific serine/threonine protein kinase n=1 Tax=Sphenostylis stenocarpa TaxID=92480 RepID=A0AA86V9E5_9FABA|nr:unnamed protein product [Sphenostylis stenocarpa]